LGLGNPFLHPGKPRYGASVSIINLGRGGRKGRQEEEGAGARRRSRSKEKEQEQEGQKEEGAGEKEKSALTSV
jgi:hypothetical protein